MGEGHLPPLPAWLAAGLADRPELLITARQTYSLRAVDFDQPALIVPLQGEKVFTAEQVTTHVGPGSYLMVHRACRGTVENITGRTATGPGASSSRGAWWNWRAACSKPMPCRRRLRSATVARRWRRCMKRCSTSSRC